MYGQCGGLAGDRPPPYYRKQRISRGSQVANAAERLELEDIARALPELIHSASSNGELDQAFLAQMVRIGFRTAGYLRIFGEGRFHTATFLFGATVPGWSERYQAKGYSIQDPVLTAACRSTGAFTLEEVAGRSREGAQILADSRSLGLIDGFVTSVRAGFDEIGFVLIGSDHLLNPSGYERLLLQAMCEAYGRAGLALLPRGEPPPLTRREGECLRWVAAGRSDPQIGMILGLSSNTVHAHVESAKTKLGANSRAQLVLRAAMSGLLRSDGC
jgi:LuxR family quorum sensing-dependent transcriptional regulator